MIKIALTAPLVALTLALLVVLSGCTGSKKSGDLASNTQSANRRPASELVLHALEDPAQGVTPLTRAQEDQIIRGVADGILATIATTRDAHPKAHGCVADAKLTVSEDLDPQFRAGVFAKPGTTYDTIVRFSSGSSNPKADDRIPSTQGMAVKIKLPAELQAQIPDLAGEVYFLPKETYKTYDIITINAVEEFVVNDLPTYPFFIKASTLVGKATTDAISAGKKPAEIQAIVGKIFFDEYISKLPPQLQPVAGALLQKLGSSRPTNLLNETYSSWAAYAFDAQRAVKYSFRPCSKLNKTAVAASSADFLGEQLHNDLGAPENEGCFDLVAQFHEQGMPSVENAALPWGDPESRKYIKLATLKLSHQFEDPAFCEALSYNPSHALPDQRGVGAVQRARRVIYAEISNRRNTNVNAKGAGASSNP